jgi:MbtH protein
MSTLTDKFDHYTIDGDVFKVLINEEGQYSLWPEAQNAPLGWNAAGCQGSKSECLAFVEQNWTDMRPISLQKLMAKD